MRGLKSHISVLLIGVFALSAFSGLQAQDQVAVQMEIPQDSVTFSDQLSFLKEHHIDLVILEGRFNDPTRFALIESDIPFLLKFDHRYLTMPEFEAIKQDIAQDVSVINALLDTVNTFRGSIVTQHSLTDKPYFSSSDQVYFIEGDSVVSLNNSVIASICDVESDNTSRSLAKFKSCLEENRGFSVLSFAHLNSLLGEFPDLKSAFLEDNIRAEVIALPELAESPPLIHWSILVLIGLWISLVVNIKLNPGYYEMIPRYFTAHRFFVDDIVSYRERSASSALFLLFQHAIFGGLIVYILSKVFISDIGLDALYHHLPYLGILGQNNFSLFVLSAVLIFLVELIALIWIYIPNTELSHFNQALNLFTWIFHLDFLIATLIVTLYFAGFGTISISILAVTYLLIWFSSFNITALNASKRLGMKRNSYLLKTIGLHTVVSFCLVALLLYFDAWWELVKLVVGV